MACRNSRLYYRSNNYDGICRYCQVYITSKASFASGNSHKKPEVSIYQDIYFITKLGEGFLFPFHLALRRNLCRPEYLFHPLVEEFFHFSLIKEKDSTLRIWPVKKMIAVTGDKQQNKN